MVRSPYVDDHGNEITPVRKLAPVEVLYEKNYRDIPAMLRKLANDIEAGTFGEAVDALCVLETDKKVEVFGWGEAQLKTTLGLMELGKRKLYEIWADAEAQSG
jgi:hypothetical protein